MTFEAFARWTSKVPLVMTIRASVYVCTYSRASLGPLFLIEMLEGVCWTGFSCGIPREDNGTYPDRCWVLLMV